MAEEGRGIAMAILGIVAVIAVVGLVLLFRGGAGQVVLPGGKVYPGHVVTGDTGPGFQYSGEGAYVYEQQGSCLSNEFFTQNPLANGCRPGEMRVSVWQRSRKFFGAPNQQYTQDGWCCLQPNIRAPRAE
jgi:hypothetical protein